MIMPNDKTRFFERDNNAGKIKGTRKRGRRNMRWIDSIIEAIGMGLQTLSCVVEQRIL